MANEIYDVTWWGDTYNTSSTLITLPTLPNSYQFIDRVESDGGTFVDSGCYRSIVSSNPLLFDLIFIFKERVINDGGTINETYCTSLKTHKISNT